MRAPRPGPDTWRLIHSRASGAPADSLWLCRGTALAKIVEVWKRSAADFLRLLGWHAVDAKQVLGELIAGGRGVPLALFLQELPQPSLFLQELPQP
jgi:hypothetical protein